MAVSFFLTESMPYYISLFCNLRNLHLFPEKRKNNAKNFVQGAKKAVKNLDMLGRLKSVFPSGRKLAAMSLPFLLAFSVASNKAGAEEIKTPKTGTQIAMNTKAEGSGTKAEPASLKVPVPSGPDVVIEPPAPGGEDNLRMGDGARRYSMDNAGIGVFINLAKVPEIPLEELIPMMYEGFLSRNIPVKFFASYSEGDLTGITYFLKGTPFGGPDGDGYDLGNSHDGFNLVAKAYEQEFPLQTSRLENIPGN